MIPLVIKVFFKNGDSRIIKTLLEGKNRRINAGEDVIAYKVNHEQSGFYRVRYIEKDNLRELGRGVTSKALSSKDRWGLQNDLYAFVRAGDVSINEYLNFLSNYSAD